MLTPLQERKAKRMFEIFDTNKDGTIERDDFNLILNKLSEVVPFSKQSETYRGLSYLYQNRWKKMLFFADGIVDNEKDQKISLDEWVAYCNSLIEKKSYEEDILPITCYVIRLFADQNKKENFKIDSQVFEKFFSAYSIDKQLAVATFEKLDTEKKGYLTEDEITTYWREFYESDDESALGNYFFGKY
ncbi:EF-hand domain-containing protein [Bernardetia sp.]|uniref:EF-hand domain-containing protein n=1 Tax=Bernardetia sp. TaxID=1937974 RepID=UPI0025C1BAEE|nr:hypothetical protein [Bernardetia sp.]